MNKLNIGVYEFLGLNNDPVFINIIKDRIKQLNINATVSIVNNKDKNNSDLIIYWCASHINDNKGFFYDRVNMLDNIDKAIIGCWPYSNAFRLLSEGITPSIVCSLDEIIDHILKTQRILLK